MCFYIYWRYCEATLFCDGRRRWTRTTGVSTSRIYSPLPSPLGYPPIWWEMRGSNPHAEALVPKTSVSANSTNLPYICRQVFDYYLYSLLEVFFNLPTLAYEYRLLVLPQRVELCVRAYKARPQNRRGQGPHKRYWTHPLSLSSIRR